MKLFSFLRQSKKAQAFIGAFFLLLVMFLIALFSSRGAFGIPGDSGTTDEVAHIPAGYSYIKYHDYRLNPEHPPLAKALAGVPLALQKNIVGPINDWSWNGINQWEAGWNMLYEVGNNPAQVLFWARLPIMLLMIVLGIFLYKWAAEWYGRKAGLLTLALFAFYPDIIAHGRLVTTDIAAALGYVIAIYFFNKVLSHKTWKWILIAALAFAIAQLLKFSAFLLFFIFLIMIVAKAIIEKEKGTFWFELWRYFKIYFWVCFFSILIVWIIYIPFVWSTPADIEHKVIEMNLTADLRTLPLRNFLHLLESNIITRALGHYLLGIMLVIGRVEGGNATFIMGHLSDKSISWYFPVAYLIKTPLTIIILFFWSIITYLWQKGKSKKEVWQGIVIFAPIVVYWAFTLRGSLNIGIRHLMPTIPFVLLLIAYLINRIFQQKIVYKKVIVGILILFMMISTLSYYPSFIGYFNELIPREKRHDYLIDSSLDWGQDLLRLKKYVDDNNINKIKVDYFGGSIPKYYIPQSEEWHSSYGPTTGWLAVSATFYQSSKLYGEKEGKWSYGWLDNIKPRADIGGSILVYNITVEDLIAHPPVSLYTITKLDKPGTINLNEVGL